MSHVKFWVEPCETVPGRWQVVGQRGEQERSFLIDSCLSRRAALAHLSTAERAALFAGATVIA